MTVVATRRSVEVMEFRFVRMTPWIGSILASILSPAFAADVPAPIYKARPSTAVSATGWYAKFDGAYQRVNLPSYGLGFRNMARFTPFTDLGVHQSFSQRLDGYSVRGAVGHFLPAGSWTALGANARIEVGAQYGEASQTQSAASSFTSGAALVFLDGSGRNLGLTCFGVGACSVSSNQKTDYSRWQIHGKAAGDRQFGNITLTPSLAVFGGETRNDQTLTQTFVSGAVTATYSATTSLHWNDIGARAGLNARLIVTEALAIELGGYAGLAHRSASLNGSDSSVTNVPVAFAGASAISVSGNTTPFVANAEFGFAFKPTGAVTVRGFAGLNFDSKVPSIAAPSYAGSITVSPTRTGAGISFQSETSYYAGGGLTVAF